MTSYETRLLPENVSDELDREQLRRANARTWLLDFCQYVTPWFQTPRHIRYVSPFYEAIEAGDIDRLMFLTAPRHGKTSLGQHFCAKYLGGNPEDELIAASYNSRIAGQFGGKVRNIVARPQYQRLATSKWGCQLRPDSQAKDLWHTTSDGVFLATGLGGGATGFGANGLLIDDFLKGRAEADSETIREDIEQWYSGEAYTRLMPRRDGRPPWVIMEYTTWHESDLGQKEIQAMLDGTGDNWWVVRLPAIAEENDLLGRLEGEALWPERYPIERLERIRSVLNRINPRDFVSLFQASPSAMEGTYYKREMMPDSAGAVHVGRRSHYIVTDWATGDGSDYTVHGVFAVDYRTDIEVVDWFREKCDTLVGSEALLNMVQKWRAVGNGVAGWIHPKGVLDKGSGPLTHLRARQRNIPLPPEIEYSESSSKEALSGSIQGYMAAGRVLFPHNAPWFADLQKELLGCWSASNDDQADVLKLMGMHLEQVVAPPLKEYEMQPAPDERMFG